jgi:hypothetical protein
VKSRTIITSAGSIAIGIFIQCFSAFILFKDVIDGKPFTLDHAAIVGVMIAAAASTHKCWPLIKERNPWGLLLAVSAVASVSMIVVLVGEKTSKLNAATMTENIEHNRLIDLAWQDHATAKNELVAAKSDANIKRVEMQRECATGLKSQTKAVSLCDSKAWVLNVAESQVKKNESHVSVKLAEAKSLGGKKETGLKYEAFGKFASWFGGSAAKIQEFVNDAFLYAMPLSIDFVGLAMMSIGLTHIKVAEKKPAIETLDLTTAPQAVTNCYASPQAPSLPIEPVKETLPEPPVEVKPEPEKPEPVKVDPPSPVSTKQPDAKPVIVKPKRGRSPEWDTQEVLAALAKMNGGPVCVKDLAFLMKCSPSEASKRWKSAYARGAVTMDESGAFVMIGTVRTAPS